MYNSTVRVELYNMDWARAKKVSEMRSKLTHAHCVFVEDNQEKKAFDKLNWYKSMMNETNIFKFFINFGESSFAVNINRAKTLGDLKKKIGAEIGLTSDEFNIKRQGVVTVMKDTSLTLLQLGLTNKAIIKVERGSQHEEGVYDIQISLVELVQEKEYEEDQKLEKDT